MMKKQILAALAGAVLALGMLSGCQLPGTSEPQPQTEEQTQPAPPPSDPGFPAQVDFGEDTVTVEKKPQHIVALTPDYAELVLDLDGEGVLCGVGDLCGAVLDVHAPAMGTPEKLNVEAVIAAQTEYLLTSSPLREDQKSQLEEAGVQVLTEAPPSDRDAAESRIQHTAELLYGQETNKGRELSEQLQSDLEKIMEQVAVYQNVVAQQQTAVLLAWPDRTITTGDTWEGMLLEDLGLENLGRDGEGWSVPEDTALSPDVILYDKSIAPEQITESKTYADSPAVKNDKLYAVDLARIQRQGSGMVQEVQAVAQALYPEAFSGSAGK